MKLNAKLIGINEKIDVKPTNYYVDLANQMYIKLVKINIEALKAKESSDQQYKEQGEKSVEEQIQESEKSIKAVENDLNFHKEAYEFLSDVLGLDEKQVTNAKKLIDDEALGGYLFYVTGRLRGIPEEAFESAESKVEQDPKKG